MKAEHAEALEIWTDLANVVVDLGRMLGEEEAATVIYEQAMVAQQLAEQLTVVLYPDHIIGEPDGARESLSEKAR
jgi:hypothetical protein